MSSTPVGSTIRATTRSRNISSATTPKPRLAYIPANAWYNRTEDALSTRERGTTCRADGVTEPPALLGNSPGGVGGETISAFEATSVTPRSSTP